MQKPEGIKRKWVAKQLKAFNTPQLIRSIEERSNVLNIDFKKSDL